MVGHGRTVNRLYSLIESNNWFESIKRLAVMKNAHATVS